VPKIFRDVDASVGRRLRLRRNELGLSMAALGEKTGVTYQQIQKYESGTNRISAGVLYVMSKELGVPVTYFFEDAEENSRNGGRRKPR
jgi:transcriptional regulator with XRE-family HTH domain